MHLFFFNFGKLLVNFTSQEMYKVYLSLEIIACQELIIFIKLIVNRNCSDRSVIIIMLLKVSQARLFSSKNLLCFLVNFLWSSFKLKANAELSWFYSLWNTFDLYSWDCGRWILAFLKIFYLSKKTERVFLFTGSLRRYWGVRPSQVEDRDQDSILGWESRDFNAWAHLLPRRVFTSWNWKPSWDSAPGILIRDVGIQSSV